MTRPPEIGYTLDEEKQDKSREKENFVKVPTVIEGALERPDNSSVGICLFRRS